MIDTVKGRTVPTVETTLERLTRVWPYEGWKFAENYLVYRGTLWLQFSSEYGRRMYWVRNEDSDDVVRVWDLGEIPDLV